MRSAERVSLALLLATGLLYAASNVEHESSGVTITPKVIQMGAFYRGAAVKVDGVAENGTNVIITLSGADSEERFNLKSRFGFIWVNSGKVRISRAPSLFLQFSSAPLRTLLPPSAIEQDRLNQNAILHDLRIEPQAPSSRELLGSNFLAYKTTQGRYQFADAGVIMATPGSSGTPYTLTFQLPKTAPPATYELRVYEVKDGAVTRQLSVPLQAVRVGLPAWLARLSTEQPVYYGLAAVITAVLAGFGVDRLVTMIFGKKQRIAH